MAYAATKLILHLAFQIGGPNNYVPISATPSLPVLLFTLGISVLTGVIFGIAPAWMTSHADPVEALRGANRSVGSGRRLLLRHAQPPPRSTTRWRRPFGPSPSVLRPAGLFVFDLNNAFGFETWWRYRVAFDVDGRRTSHTRARVRPQARTGQAAIGLESGRRRAAVSPPPALLLRGRGRGGAVRRRASRPEIAAPWGPVRPDSPSKTWFVATKEHDELARRREHRVN